ncbi:MAG TPA: hypothetical protein VFS24_10890 [Steroidobacteraceae bacterium]|nr:hypothetical protein [Steroidobacteraceae bacterium]
MSNSSETAKRAALQFVLSSDMPSEHKAVILEALRDSLAQDALVPAVQAPDPEWNPHEETEIHEFLAGKLAHGWQHADELVMALSARLHRDPDAVRRKAVELGHGASVDYRLARRAAHEHQQ